MAALLPLIQELLPMILPSKVHVTKAEELRLPPSTEDDNEDYDKNVEESAVIRDVERLSERHGDGLPQRSQRERPGRKSMERNGRGTSIAGRAGDYSNEKQERPRAMPEGTRHRRKRSLFSDNEDEVGEDEAYGEVYEEPQPEDRPSRDGEPAARGLDGLSVGQHRQQQPGGVTMRDAIVHKTSSMCASVLTVKPQCATIVFHNGEQESIVYAISGQAVLATLPDDDDDNDETAVPAPPTRTILGPGDFAFVPAWTEHQVINESSDTDVSWVIVHNGAEPTVVPLTEFGGPEAKF